MGKSGGDGDNSIYINYNICLKLRGEKAKLVSISITKPFK